MIMRSLSKIKIGDGSYYHPPPPFSIEPLWNSANAKKFHILYLFQKDCQAQIMTTWLSKGTQKLIFHN
jgi:hypothetical protein